MTLAAIYRDARPPRLRPRRPLRRWPPRGMPVPRRSTTGTRTSQRPPSWPWRPRSSPPRAPRPRSPRRSAPCWPGCGPGWLLGQASAESLVTGEEADWRGSTPGDATAAQAQASAGLGAFLAGQSGVADGIAATYADRMAAVLASAEGLDPDELTANLRDALASEHAAGVIAHTEMSRAQFRAAGDIYRADGIAFIDVITAEDDRVCAVCEGLQDANPHDIRSFGVDDLLPAHPFCRCVAVPAVQSAARNSLLHGRVMADLFRRVLSDGYVPVALGRDRGLRSQAAAVDAASAEPDLDAAPVVQHQQHRGRTSDAGLDL